MRTNRDRAVDFAGVLDYFEAEDPETGLIDILTNAQHFCNQTSVDFENCLRIAKNHFHEEVSEESEP